jgi:hypothetical protein
LIRELRVVVRIPRRRAAPSGPEILPPQLSRARSMLARSRARSQALFFRRGEA